MVPRELHTNGFPRTPYSPADPGLFLFSDKAHAGGFSGWFHRRAVPGRIFWGWACRLACPEAVCFAFWLSRRRVCLGFVFPGALVSAYLPVFCPSSARLFCALCLRLCPPPTRLFGPSLSTAFGEACFRLSDLEPWLLQLVPVPDFPLDSKSEIL